MIKRFLTTVFFLNRYPTMIMCAILLHVVWGVSAIYDSAAYQSTALSALYRVFGPTAAFVCLAVAFLASMGMGAATNVMVGLALMLPQQTILIISAFGAFHAMYLSQFADGVERARSFIICDQVFAIIAALGHTIAMLRFTLRGRLLK